MTREEMLVDLLSKAEEEIKLLKEQTDFLRKEIVANRQLTNMLAGQVFKTNKNENTNNYPF